MLKTWLARSGKQLFDLRVAFRHGGTLGSLQSDVDGLWQAFMPNLPRIRSFEGINFPAYIERLLLFELPWPQLTSLVLNTIPVEPKTALNLLRRTPLIVNASLDLRSTGMDNYTGDGFVCAHLRDLEIGPLGHNKKIISLVTLPSLEKLYWLEYNIRNVWWLWHDFHALVERSSCNVKALNITYGSHNSDGAVFIDSLKICPMLEVARFGNGAAVALNGTVSQLVVNRAKRNFVILPRLQVFTLSFTHSAEINEIGLSLMLESRWDDRDQWQSEKKLHLIAVLLEFPSYGPLPDFTSGPLSVLRRMKREGLDFAVSKHRYDGI